ncbi:hypothetical protein LE181_24610 [Streptomyces sp. SCA3-4]|uniref:hypothetical protein n=1 Tax=Streptomyces sichuanensis TaxID=2871810 RepID=UPI001CE28777|nr:hypothetical protein [Streptomyces sichuanensis]MCA6095335.1 hypothetical protein [Streptomyces sichuanensis]
MVRAPSVSGASSRRAANFRMIVLAGAVTLAVALPLAVASAGPAGPAAREKSRPKAGSDKIRGKGGYLPRPAGFSGPGAVGAPLGPDGDQPAASGLLGFDAADAGAAGPDGAARGAARCGPELASPAGVEAQTCVMEQGRDTWARTYYRNASGIPLTGVLTLMAPGGRTVQVPCPMAATDDPDMCETPHGTTLRGHGSYAAVAEIASAEGKLLLRSGSNSPEPEEG